MTHHLLDTNICVHTLKNEFGIRQLIAETGIQQCFLSQITVAELLFGIENSAPERRSHNRQNLEQFQDIFSGRILGIDQALAEYARQKVMLRQMGRPVDDFDLLIGATAIAHNLILVTRNTRHFADMSGIQLVNWVDG